MIDWSALLHAMHAGRWEAFVLIGNAVWTDVRTIWWFGPLVLMILVTMGRRKLLRLANKVAGAYWSSHR
ncbi:hypothetical protein ABIC47_003474 [Leifsonia sp. 563]|uniref:hypothetical protein n=1 Tax=Leifsonia sp. 563 TaxID=3156412 RepID=UPI00339B987C